MTDKITGNVVIMLSEKEQKVLGNALDSYAVFLQQGYQRMPVEQQTQDAISFTETMHALGYIRSKVAPNIPVSVPEKV